MNLLLVADDFGGGAGNIIQILAKEFTQRGDSVTLYMTNLHSQMRYELDDVEIIDAAWSNMTGNWLSIQHKRIKGVQALVEEKQYDIVISFLDNNNTIVCLALKNKRIPIIVSERSNPLVIYPKFPWNYMRTYAYRRADLITVQFEAFRMFDKQRFVNKSIVIPNIILTSAYRKVHKEKTHISFVSLGRNHQIKQFPKMIELFREFMALGGDAELHIYGREIATDASLNQFLLDYSLQDRVFLHEAVSNVHDTLIQHDAYLMTSAQEGFPNGLCEAIACGLPVIAFRCHSGIDDLIHQGENGYCVAPDDADAFVEAMRTIAIDSALRQRMGEHGITIAEQYDHSHVMQIWDKAIQQAQSRYNGSETEK